MSEQSIGFKGSSELKRRVITSVIGVPIVVAMVWFDQPIPWFTVLAAAWGLVQSMSSTA